MNRMCKAKARELNFITKFIAEGYLDEEIFLELLSALWRVYCLHYDLCFGSADYESDICILWDAVEESEFDLWDTFEDFSEFLDRQTVLMDI